MLGSLSISSLSTSIPLSTNGFLRLSSTSPSQSSSGSIGVGLGGSSFAGGKQWWIFGVGL